MSDPLWFRRDHADEVCADCGYLLHALSHEHMHRMWIEHEVADYRRELGIVTEGPHLHMEPRKGESQ